MERPPRSGLENVTFALIVVGFVLYAAGYIWKTSFEIGGERYFSLHDDAMISMRYARNLATGRGLVWNPGGERVEGYTNPLWVLFMALVHLSPLPASKASLAVQIAGAAVLCANLFVVRRIAEEISEQHALVVLPAVLLTALYLPLNTWSLQGMEVGPLTLLLCASLLSGMRSLKRRRLPLSAYAMLGVGTLLRMDMAVPFVVFLLFFAIAERERARSQLLLGGGILLLCLALQTLFRYAYYGDLLPNTYHLKLTGFPLPLRISRGLWVLAGFLFRSNWILVLLVPLAWLLEPRRPVSLLAAALSGQFLYSAWVGGDAWEWWGGSNRYVTIAMPAFFVLFSLGAARLLRRIRGHVELRFAGRLAYAVFVLASLVSFNAFRGKASLKEWLLSAPPLLVPDNQRMLETALKLEQATSPDARVAVVWAGILPYFCDRPAIDLLGKNDRRIARERMRIPPGASRFTAFYPGHMKYDYRYSIGELEPDVVVQLWEDVGDALPILERDYRESAMGRITCWVRKDSTRVRLPSDHAGSPGDPS